MTEEQARQSLWLSKKLQALLAGEDMTVALNAMGSCSSVILAQVGPEVLQGYLKLLPQGVEEQRRMMEEERQAAANANRPGIIQP